MDSFSRSMFSEFNEDELSDTEIPDPRGPVTTSYVSTEMDYSYSTPTYNDTNEERIRLQKEWDYRAANFYAICNPKEHIRKQGRFVKHSIANSDFSRHQEFKDKYLNFKFTPDTSFVSGKQKSPSVSSQSSGSTSCKSVDNSKPASKWDAEQRKASRKNHKRTKSKKQKALRRIKQKLKKRRLAKFKKRHGLKNALEARIIGYHVVFVQGYPVAIPDIEFIFV